MLTKWAASRFTPSQESSVDLWLSVVDSTITKDGSNLVSQWNDLSPAANNVTSSGADRPTYTADDGRGYPCITSNNKIMDAGSGWTSVTEETWFIVCEIDAVSSTVEGVIGAVTGNYGLYHDNTATVAPNPARINWTTASSTTHAVGSIRDQYDYNIGKPKILTLRRKVGTGRAGIMEIYENGQLLAIDVHSSGTETFTPRIGARNTSRGIVNFYEVIHCNTAVSDSRKTQFESYLNSKYGVYSVPSWCSASLPQVIRYAIANNIASAGAMPGGNKYFWSLIGDSTAQGYSLKSAYDVALIKLYGDAFIYNWTPTPNAWEAYDCRDAVTRNDRGRLQAECGLDVAMHGEMTGDSKVAACMKYIINGSALADTGTDNNWNVTRSTSTYPTTLRRYTTQSLNREVALNGSNLINFGCITYLGTNDAVDAYYAAIETNMVNLINFYRAIPGMSSTRVAINQIFSNSGTYTRITEARAALVSAAASLSNCQLFSSNDNAAGTVDGTHPNHTQYLSRAVEQNTYLGS